MIFDLDLIEIKMIFRGTRETLPQEGGELACVTEGGPPESELVDLDGGKELRKEWGNK